VAYFRPSNYGGSNNKFFNDNTTQKRVRSFHFKFFRVYRALDANRNAFMKIWAPPIHPTNLFTKKLHRSIFVMSGQDYGQPLFNYNADLFKGEPDISVLKELANDFITNAIKTREMAQNDRRLVLYGEPGTGKTTTINAMFTVFSALFKKHNVFWLRLGIDKDVYQAKANGAIVSAFFRKFYRLILIDIDNKYAMTMKLDSPETVKSIFPLEFDAILTSGDDNTSFVDKLRFYFEDKLSLFFARMCSYLYHVVGFSFIFLIDNIDRIHLAKGFKPEMMESIIDESLSLIFQDIQIDIPALRVYICRGQTIGDNVNSFREARQANGFDIKYIGQPDIPKIIKKRMEFIRYNVDHDKKELGEDLGDLPILPVFEELIQKYILENGAPADIFMELSNFNVQKLFNMIHTVVGSNLIREDTPLIDPKVADPAVLKRLNRMREHNILWSLMVRDKRLYYRNRRQDTWIFNVYENCNDKEIEYEGSYFIKRLILDYLRGQQSNNIDRVYYHNIFTLFTRGFGYDKEDVATSINTMVDFNMLYKYKEENDDHEFICITPRGDFLAGNVLDKYIYHELVLEDTAVPEDLVKDLALFEYDPIIDKTKYLQKKVPMVRKFVKYLQKVEEHEYSKRDEKYHVFCKKRYFPQLRHLLADEESAIARSFGIAMESYIASIDVKW
jgi:hypothetical protein